MQQSEFNSLFQSTESLDKKVFLVKLPTQVLEQINAYNDQLSNGGKADIEIGEVVLEQAENTAMEIDVNSTNTQVFQNPQLIIKGENTKWCLRMDRI